MKGAFLLVLMACASLHGFEQIRWRWPHYQFPSLKSSSSFGHWLCDGLTTIFEDTFDLHCNLFSMTTLKIGVATVPLYIISRLSDRHVHQQFYDDNDHKNVKQLPHGFTRAVERGGDIGILALTSLAFFANDPCLRTTSRVFAIGAASALVAKDITRKLTRRDR